MDFFASNGADKPKQKKARPWYRTGVGLLMLLTLVVATLAFIFSILQVYYSQFR